MSGFWPRDNHKQTLLRDGFVWSKQNCYSVKKLLFVEHLILLGRGSDFLAGCGK